MAKTHQRVFALAGAILFFGTSVAVSGIVVWQVRQQNQAEKAAKSAGAASDAADTIQKQPKEGQLQGTKLQNFTPVASVPTLQSNDLVVGTGDTVREGDTITAHYTGALAGDGTIFQSSKDTGQPATFPLSGVIKGWTDGVPGMKVGGTRRLVIPYAQAYGEAGRPDGGIPAKADLVFDIELVKIGQ